MKITCPQCGADIDIQPRNIQLTCPFCNTPLIFKKEPSLESYRIEPTWEEEPTIALVKQFLIERSLEEKIEKMELLNLPFYRFLYEKKGKIVEKVFSALSSPPFLLFTIPSGSMIPMGENSKGIFVRPEKKLSLVLEKMKKERVKALEEMLLLYFPFWKVTIPSGKIIWLDAVQGKILASNIQKIQKTNARLIKTLFSGLLIVLLVEGFATSSNILGFLLQGVTTIGFFYLMKRKFNNEY